MRLWPIVRTLMTAVGFAALGVPQMEAAPFSFVVDTNSNLARLDLATGGTTLIGPNVALAGLGWGPGGVLYGVNAANNLVTVNAQTGATTLIGPLGITAET